MKRIRPQDIVAFLGFSETAIAPERVRNTSPRDWQKLLQWLDDAGLAFYFLQKLKEVNAADSVPANVFSQLEMDFAANHQRTDYLRQRFSALNRQFQDAGVKYVVVKGFSLIPQFSPDAALRHQADLDYLIDEQSLPKAQQLLEKAEYCLKAPISDQEFIYLLPNIGEPKAGRCYAPEFHAVELHLDIWDSNLNRLPAMKRMFSVESAEIHEANALCFPALSEEDAFLLQVMHACRHLFTYWIRMSCLYEIAYFLARRVADTPFWNRIGERTSDNFALRELTVVVSEMAASLFGTPIPGLLEAWGKQVRPSVRVWIDSYARHCAFSDLPVYRFDPFPRSKLILFLHQQYEDRCAESHVVRNQLIAPTRLRRMGSDVKRDPLLLLSRRWWKRQRVLRRSAFHLLSGLRYGVEIPRWKWLNWMRSRTAPSVANVLDEALPARTKHA